MKKLNIFFECAITLGRYSFDDLSEFSKENNILLYPAHEEDKVQQYSSYFSKLYPVNTIKEGCTLDGDLSQWVLKYDESYNIVKNIQQYYPSMDLVLITCFELFTTVVGKLRDELGIPGPGFEQMNIYRNKQLMKNFLHGTGVPTPKSNVFDHARYKLNADKYYDDIADLLKVPFMLKVVDGASGIGVHKISSKKYFMSFQNKLDIFSEYFVEEFIEGELFHVDIALQNGITIFFSPAKYLNTNMTPPFNSMGGSCPIYDESLSSSFLDHSLKIIDSLGTFDGLFHIEFFVSINNEILFLEAASRPGGANIAKMYGKMYGMNLYNLNAKLAIKSTNYNNYQSLEKKTFCFEIISLQTCSTHMQDLEFQSQYIIEEKEYGVDYMLFFNDDNKALCADFKLLETTLGSNKELG